MYNEEYLKNKIKSYNGVMNTNFYENEIRKKGVSCVCLLTTLLHSIFKIDKHYWTQSFFKRV